jgi:hypothetical protein
VVASWSAYVLLLHIERNACASMAMQKWLRFPCKGESYGQVSYVGVADIHHHVLKSTTSAGAVRDVRDMRERRDSKFRTSNPRVSPVPLVSLVSPLSSGGSELPLGLALRYG